MKIFSIKKINKLLLFLFLIPLYSAPYPPVSSTYQLRIVNRRFISHLVFENIQNRLFLTIILTHGPNYHAYKSNSYRLYYECFTTENCLRQAKEIDNFLKTGYNIAFVIDGDFIKKIIFLTENNS
ncbi:MAG: hypothetical protein KatS3mg129_0984 [Leptospiraceae bacterium]|nr:MAG: hypothetical protein KatS3mg129_0984 [Leptospiraceae bacterium]